MSKQSAYLILRAAGRWSDVYRLTPPEQAFLGRSSSNQIVLRSERASRQHARIFWDPGDKDGEGAGWAIEDLGSRNGTFVEGQRLVTPVKLSGPGSLHMPPSLTGEPESTPIEISAAGFSITFAEDMHVATGHLPATSSATEGETPITDDQITMEFDPAAITDRRRQSRYLAQTDFSSSAEEGTAGEASVLISSRLLQFAFQLARHETVKGLVESTLEMIDVNVRCGAAGIYIADTTKSERIKAIEHPLVAAKQFGKRSYHRPPDSLIASLDAPNCEATLARNIIGDPDLASQNSEGEMDVETLILAPLNIKPQASSPALLCGYIHLTTSAGQPPMTVDDLERIVAISQILTESLRAVGKQQSLVKSLNRSRRKVKLLTQQVNEKVKLVGSSPAMVSVIEKTKLAAPTNATVLVQGESGVGKELITAALHHASARSEGPLLCINCAALSPTLLESELFGHEAGAFTGATGKKIGKFEAAHTGTLMLDEIGEMNADIQAKFLRVLEGHPFERVGGNQPIQVDVRVVAATNRNLRQMVHDGQFRQDLFFRLNVVEVTVPPLRQRGEDILRLADFFLDRFNQEMGRKIEAFSDSAKQKLVDHTWPGNVRELKNAVERAVVLNSKPIIEVADLQLGETTFPDLETEVATKNNTVVDETMTLAELEKQHIERVLRRTAGNKSRAAKILGIERSTLDRKMKRWLKKQ